MLHIPHPSSVVNTKLPHSVILWFSHLVNAWKHFAVIPQSSLLSQHQKHVKRLRTTEWSLYNFHFDCHHEWCNIKWYKLMLSKTNIFFFISFLVNHFIFFFQGKILSKWYFGWHIQISKICMAYIYLNFNSCFETFFLDRISPWMLRTT